MIEPWQVWLADLDPTVEHEQGGTRPVVVVSSDLHLRSQSGRSVLACPITSRFRNVRNHIPIANLQSETSYVMTEQIRYLSTLRFRYTAPWWSLDAEEIDAIRLALPYMMDL